MLRKLKGVGCHKTLFIRCLTLTPYLRNKGMRQGGRNPRHFSITQCFSIWDAPSNSHSGYICQYLDNVYRHDCVRGGEVGVTGPRYASTCQSSCNTQRSPAPSQHRTGQPKMSTVPWLRNSSVNV